MYTHTNTLSRTSREDGFQRLACLHSAVSGEAGKQAFSYREPELGSSWADVFAPFSSLENSAV